MVLFYTPDCSLKYNLMNLHLLKMLIPQKTFFNKLKHFVLFYFVFCNKIIMKWNIFSSIYCRIGLIINTKFIHISIKSGVFFILFTDQSFEMFPKHRGVATIAESFALNFTISLPLTNK